MVSDERIVITGIGLTAPNGNTLQEFRGNLLRGASGIEPYSIRHIGDTVAGVCNYDPCKYQTRKQLRSSTRAASIAIYCAGDALADANLTIDDTTRSRIGVYLGITEHGNVETENEIHELSQYDYDVRYWSHYHNPRTVANNPAGEVTVNFGITGPHYTLGAACAAGNIGLVQGCQQLLLGEVDTALAGGVSESIHTFGIFAGFRSQGALASHADPTKASRPFDRDRNGIVISEGGCVFTLERLRDARRRQAPIYGEVVGHALNSDATDMVLPNPERQAQCMRQAIERTKLAPEDISLLSTHATGTPAGDAQEIRAIRDVFNAPKSPLLINNTKSMIGHAMGAAGALELAGNLPAFQDGIVHPTINVDNLDPDCEMPGLVLGTPRNAGDVRLILNNSFGMVGINCAVIVQRFEP